MHDHWYGPHDFGPAPLWASALLSGISLLWWIGLPVLLVWVGSRLLGQHQAAPPAEALLEPAGPSAREMLRRRYVLGEIDAYTFEQMLERVMFSEEQERSGQRLVPRGAPSRGVEAAQATPGRVRIWEPDDGQQNGQTDDPTDGYDPRDLPPPTTTIEMV